MLDFTTKFITGGTSLLLLHMFLFAKMNKSGIL